MFSREALAIDAAAAAAEIEEAIRAQVQGELRRRGAVVCVSGGVDSAVTAALCARALGADRVLALLMPERDSSEESLRLGRLVAERLCVPSVVEEITTALEGLGCYARQAEAIRTAFPDYGPGHRAKISLPSIREGERLSVFRLTVRDPSGVERTARLSQRAYLQLVAATSFKQRVRATLAYYHADRQGYAVVGSHNRVEHDQGFFVKQGDGAADLEPIRHLYKTQVYALAEHIGIPEEVRARTPTTDTYSLPQTQEEFYFGLPLETMDLCLYALDHGIAASEVAPAARLSPDEVERAFRDIEAKRRATRALHLPPLAVRPAARP